MSKHYGDADGLRVLSYNAIINFVNSNRNYGKTWTFQRRAFRRALKHGKKTIWLRMFKAECKEACRKLYSSRDLLKYCGATLFNPKTNKGNLKREGSVFYYRKNEKSPWKWFLQVFMASNPDAIRSADDVDCDTIVFDEYTKTRERYTYYRGNIVTNVLDMLFSTKREHQVRMIFLGNKESFSNPFFTYFGITPPPPSWEGIRSYRNGSIALQQINNMPNEESEYERKLKAALEGTAYGNYIYKSEYKATSGLKPRKTPSSASLYVQLSIKSSLLKISVKDGLYYVNRRVVRNKQIYCDCLAHRYPKERLLIKRHRAFFAPFMEALARNDVFYEDELTREAMQPFLQWLAI